MIIALCIALFALGHVVRDGWPATGSTQLARALGAALCGLGALAVLPWLTAAIVGLAVLVGFYVDQKHGEGQQARGWTDVCYLALSGVSSIIPLACVMVYLHNERYGLFALLGLLKPEIWFAEWRIFPPKLGSWFQPTRVSALTFGAIIGAAVALLG